MKVLQHGCTASTIYILLRVNVFLPSLMTWADTFSLFSEVLIREKKCLVERDLPRLIFQII